MHAFECGIINIICHGEFKCEIYHLSHSRYHPVVMVT